MQHDPASLEQLLTHRSWALKVARRLVHEEEEAEDMVQRTWIAALRRPPDRERSLKAWIHKVILNLARERHRRRLTRERHERASFGEERGSLEPIETLTREELRRVLGARILELGEPYRAIVLQRYYQGLTSEEIARQLGIPSGTVRWRLKVGLDRLREDLDRRSNGDRTRWVSALVGFLGDPAAAPEAEAERVPPSPLATWTRNPLVPLGAVALAGGAALTAILLLRPGAPPRALAAPLARAESAAPAAVREARAGPRSERESFPQGTGVSALPPPARGVSVLVVDEAGMPVPQARLLVARASGFEERVATDAAGRAWLPIGPDDPGALGLASTQGRVGVRALAKGRAASPLVHIAAPFTLEHEVRLVVGGPDAVLEGRVVDPEGNPLVGAVVALFQPDRQLERLSEGDFQSPSYLATKSDAEGRYRLEHVPEGTGCLGVLARGFATYSLFLDTRVDRYPKELRIERGGCVTGRIRRPDGTPAAGVSVGCEPVLKAAEWATGLPDYHARWRGFGETTRTDEHGEYRLEGIDTWTRRLVWAHDAAAGTAASLNVRLQPGETERWDCVLEQRDGFWLRLVDESGRPLAGWFAFLRTQTTRDSWWTRRQAADDEGRIRIADCPPGEAMVDVFPPSDSGASRASCRLRPGASEQRIEVDTRTRTTIRGRIVDAFGLPEQRGHLLVHAVQTALAAPVARDETGSFEQALTPGRYVLALHIEQSAMALAEFRVRAGEEREFGQLATPPLGTLRLLPTALHNGGQRKPSYTLYRLADRERAPGLLMVGEGLLNEEVLLPVFPGRYAVEGFDTAGGKPRARTVLVRSDAETRVDFGP